jgi:uncharacterized membrane protein YphA (DoxX/SURF4 family)
MNGFVDVELATQPPLGAAKSAGFPAGGAPPCRKSPSHSKRKSRWNNRCSHSSRRRMGTGRAAFHRRLVDASNGDHLSLLTSPAILGLRRTLRSLRPYVPYTGRLLILIFLCAHLFRACLGTPDGAFDLGLDLVCAALGTACAVLFAGMRRKHVSFRGLAAYLLYRCIRSANPRHTFLQVIHLLALSSIQSLGPCRHSFKSASLGAADSARLLVFEAKDAVLASTRLAIACTVVDASLAAASRVGLASIPAAFMFAVGYSSRRAAAPILVLLSAMATGCMAPPARTILGARGFELLPEMAVCVLMLTSDPGALSLDAMIARRERLVY